VRINHPDWYPCYLNPDFGELMELAKSGWDTCRILVNPENKDFIIASGLGNTHSSMVQCYRMFLGKRRAPATDSYILHHRGRIAYFNMEDFAEGQEYVRWPEWGADFADAHVEILKDLIRESDLAL
jgi:hypothetical protein